MDEARKFRLLIPPFFLAMSVSAGLYFCGFAFDLSSYSREELLALGAVLGAAILPVGFFLTSVSILCLHILAKVRGWGSEQPGTAYGRS